MTSRGFSFNDLGWESGDVKGHTDARIHLGHDPLGIHSKKNCFLRIPLNPRSELKHGRGLILAEVEFAFSVYLDAKLQF